MYSVKSLRNVLQNKLYLKVAVPGPSLLGTRSRHLHDQSDRESTNVASPETLVDLHGRRHDYLRISLTERCNLRCQYCMPAEGVTLSPRARLLSFAELLRLARVFTALGVHKLRLTGGEPTLRADLEQVVRALRELPGVRTVAMTSNGLALARRLPALQRAGLSHLNLSLDTLRADRFERMTRRPGLAKVLACIDVALQIGLRPLKINTVLMKGFNDDEICDFVEFTREREVEVRFIEFMPFAGNEWADARMVPERAALAAARARVPALRRVAGVRGDTATLWAAPGHAGRLGFVSSMTRPFCGGCNRLRLTADGNLKVCLFGAAEVSLRDALRAGSSDDDLAALVRAALRRKHSQHAGLLFIKNEERRYLSGVQPADDSHRRIARGGCAQGGGLALGRRAYCTAAGGGRGEGGGGGGGARLSHVDGSGRARMVNVGDKPATERAAEAECYVQVSAQVARLLHEGGGRKGDAVGAAQLAGVMAAKRTADLIPLCHTLPLSAVRVHVELPERTGGRVRVTCEARTRARTGVEMEALTGCALAALTLYDMCKSADRHMRVTGLRVTRKSGGASGDWVAPPDPDA